MNHVLRHLRRAALLTAAEGPSDTQLLDSYLTRRDEVAFETLLRRHGSMVLGVCRRVLRNLHDAEDAFQATFLVLSRSAGSIRCRQDIASWLYGVAYRTAMKARVMNAKRRAKERHAGALPRSEASASGVDEDLLAQLDHELSRLPDKYCVPVVLCELEGKSRKEAARLLGVPEGTLSSRLASAKKMLSTRLSRRGVKLSLGVFAVGLSPTLRASTLKTVFSAGSVPAKILALTEGVMKAMLLSKLKITACAAALMLLAGVGATGLTYRATAQQPRQESVQASRFQADELESLRLEIEALRKSLQATRERVRTLESEMSALKGRFDSPRASSRGMSGAQGGSPGNPGTSGGAPAPGGQSQAPDTQPSAPSIGQFGASQGSAAGAPNTPAGERGGGAAGAPASAVGQSGTPQGQGGPAGGGRGGLKHSNLPAGMWGSGGVRSHGMMGGGMMRKGTSDPVSDAEAALKKLRENPGDKQATEALERALKRLKEREKSNVPGESRP
jgi:RNA polymerase sigma factor (sigma-70 family)